MSRLDYFFANAWESFALSQFTEVYESFPHFAATDEILSEEDIRMSHGLPVACEGRRSVQALVHSVLCRCIHDEAIYQASIAVVEHTPMLQRFDRLRARCDHTSQSRTAALEYEALGGETMATELRRVLQQLSPHQVSSSPPIASPCLELSTSQRSTVHGLVQDAVRYAEYLARVGEMTAGGVVQPSRSPATLRYGEASQLLSEKFPLIFLRSAPLTNEALRLYCWLQTFSRLSTSAKGSEPLQKKASSKLPLTKASQPSVNPVATCRKRSREDADVVEVVDDDSSLPPRQSDPVQQAQKVWREAAKAFRIRRPAEPHPAPLNLGISVESRDAYGNRLRSARLAAKDADLRSTAEKRERRRACRQGYFPLHLPTCVEDPRPRRKGTRSPAPRSSSPQYVIDEEERALAAALKRCKGPKGGPRSQLEPKPSPSPPCPVRRMREASWRSWSSRREMNSVGTREDMRSSSCDSTDSLSSDSLSQSSGSNSSWDCSDVEEHRTYPPSAISNLVILSGPHGCGKTAAVYHAAALMNCHVVELNTSMLRTPKTLLSHISELIKTHQQLSRWGALAGGSATRRTTEEALQELKVKMKEEAKQKAIEEAAFKKSQKRNSTLKRTKVVTPPLPGKLINTYFTPRVAKKKEAPASPIVDVPSKPPPSRPVQPSPFVPASSSPSSRAVSTILLLEDVDTLLGPQEEVQRGRALFNTMREIAPTSQIPIVVTANTSHVEGYGKCKSAMGVYPDSPLEASPEIRINSTGGEMLEIGEREAETLVSSSGSTLCSTSGSGPPPFTLSMVRQQFGSSTPLVYFSPASRLVLYTTLLVVGAVELGLLRQKKSTPTEKTKKNDKKSGAKENSVEDSAYLWIPNLLGFVEFSIALERLVLGMDAALASRARQHLSLPFGSAPVSYGFPLRTLVPLAALMRYKTSLSVTTDVRYWLNQVYFKFLVKSEVIEAEPSRETSMGVRPTTSEDQSVDRSWWDVVLGRYVHLFSREYFALNPSFQSWQWKHHCDPPLDRHESADTSGESSSPPPDTVLFSTLYEELHTTDAASVQHLSPRYSTSVSPPLSPPGPLDKYFSMSKPTSSVEVEESASRSQWSEYTLPLAGHPPPVAPPCDLLQLSCTAVWQTTPLLPRGPLQRRLMHWLLSAQGGKEPFSLSPSPSLPLFHGPTRHSLGRSIPSHRPPPSSVSPYPVVEQHHASDEDGLMDGESEDGAEQTIDELQSFRNVSEAFLFHSLSRGGHLGAKTSQERGAYFVWHHSPARGGVRDREGVLGKQKIRKNKRAERAAQMHIVGSDTVAFEDLIGFPCLFSL